MLYRIFIIGERSRNANSLWRVRLCVECLTILKRNGDLVYLMLKLNNIWFSFDHLDIVQLHTIQTKRNILHSPIVTSIKVTEENQQPKVSFIRIERMKSSFFHIYCPFSTRDVKKRSYFRLMS